MCVEVSEFYGRSWNLIIIFLKYMNLYEIILNYIKLYELAKINS